MTEETFTELVDLYLDEEISESDLKRLKSEVSADSQRRKIFVERKRLHMAMQLALNPQLSAGSGSGVFQKCVRPSPSAFGWFIGTGLAASLAFALVFFAATLSERTDATAFGAGPVTADTSASDFLDQALSKWSSDAELKRYATRQQQGLTNERASLAAQLRLMGLRPELTPQDKELKTIDLSALQTEPSRSQAELLTALQRHSVMPEARILQFDAQSDFRTEAESQSYGGGFQSSLISFR